LSAALLSVGQTKQRPGPPGAPPLGRPCSPLNRPCLPLNRPCLPLSPASCDVGNTAARFQLGNLPNDAQPATESPGAAGTGLSAKNDITMRGMCANAQSERNERRIVFEMIEGLHFEFTAIL
jgi:hypothetical protein